MIGTLDSSRREVTIVGAGIAGLLAAYQLDKRGYAVTLLEAAPRSGGLIRTESTPWGIAETAAHSFLVSPPVQSLCDELGIELSPIRKDSRSRFVLRKGKLRRFPLGPGEALGAFLRAYFVLAKGSRELTPEFTMEEWADRHLGRAARDYLLSPFIRGIYGVEPREISANAAFPALVVPPGHSLLSSRLAKLRDPRRASRGARYLAAPTRGMGSLIESLDRRLTLRLGSRFRKGERVESLASIASAGNLLLAVPAGAAARLLEPSDGELARALSAIRYVSLVSVSAFVEGRGARPSRPGVGVLVPERESRKALGILFNSSAFPGRVTDEARLGSYTLIFRGNEAADEKGGSVLTDAPDDAIREIALRELKGILGLGSGQGELVHCIIHRWRHAIPVYDAEIKRTWKHASSGWCGVPGRLLFGNYTGQVSIRGMIETVSALAM